MATVLVAEDEFWQPGLDFAAAMRKRGHVAIRLTADREATLHRGARRWAKVPTATVNEAISDAGIPSSTGLDLIAAVRPVDWQATEPILNWLAANGYERQLHFRRSTGLAPQLIQDKRELSAFLQSAGLGVPRTWDSVEAIGDQQGPFIFKLRDQGGGHGIHRCDDRQSLLACAAMFSPLPYIVQRFHTAVPVIAAGVATQGKVVQMLTYVSVLNPQTPFRMAYGLRVVDDPLVYAYAEQVLDVLGVTGPFALDTVADDDGQPLALDMNLRIWGSWTACQAVGMDVPGAYEFALGLGPHPGPLQVSREEAAILRRPPLGVRTAGQRVRWLAAESAEIRRRSRWFGATWARCSLRDSAAWAARGSAV